ncbi:hypothetical protein WN48_11114, partial [Eufriesea mexicana]
GCSDLGDRGCVGDSWGMGDRGGDLGNWSREDWSRRGVGQGCSIGFGDWGGVGYWSSFDVAYGFHSDGSWFLADHCVESVDWVSDIVDGAFSSVSIDEGVATLDDVSVTGFLLALGVSGQAVVDVIGVAVLRMRIVVSIDGLGYHCLGYRSNYCLGYGG